MLPDVAWLPYMIIPTRFTSQPSFEAPSSASILTLLLLYQHHLSPYFFSSHSLSTFKMDTLVATYSRPMFENEGYSQEDQLELYQPVPSLSLKFAMPPVAQASNP
jgi:hypothetical protein